MKIVIKLKGAVVSGYLTKFLLQKGQKKLFQVVWKFYINDVLRMIY